MQSVTDFEAIEFFVFPSDDCGCIIPLNISDSQFKEQP